MTPRERLVELLRRYPETMPAHGSSGYGGEGSVGMPAVWRSYPIQELERCLEILRALDERNRKHVLGRYCWGDRIHLRVRKQGDRLIGLPPRSEVVIEPNPLVKPDKTHGYALVEVVVLTWPRWVEPARVERGLDVLAWCYRGEPMLPKAMVAA